MRLFIFVLVSWPALLAHGFGVVHKNPTLVLTRTTPRRVPRPSLTILTSTISGTHSSSDRDMDGELPLPPIKVEQNSEDSDGSDGTASSSDDAETQSDQDEEDPAPSNLLSSLLSSDKEAKNDSPLSMDPSDQRYSASDWLQNIKSLPGSLILRAIRGPVLIVTLWALLVSIVHLVLTQTAPALAARLCISDKPHAFLASALGLLLVFRTNSAYQRFAEARAIWERILSVSRNLSRMAVLMEADLGTDRLQRILRLLAVFPYVLDEHIHQDNDKFKKKQQAQLKAQYEANNNNNNSDDDAPLDILAVPRHVYKRERGSSKRTAGSIKLQYINTQQLPWCLLPDTTRRRCAVAENRPLYICDRLARDVYSVPLTDNWTTRERAGMLGMVDSLSSSLGACERIHQTAVPLNYARHALRCVSLWILTLPLALVQDFGLATAPVILCLAWSYFGVYQIGYTIEDPFQSALRLDTLCEIIYRNVMFGTASMRRRLAALNPEETEEEWRNLPLPPLPQKSIHKNNSSSSSKSSRG